MILIRKTTLDNDISGKHVIEDNILYKIVPVILFIVILLDA